MNPLDTPSPRDLITIAVQRHPDLEPRALRALDIVESGRVHIHPFNRRWRLVASSSNSATLYTVDLDARTCSCPDFIHNNPPHHLCKHLIAALAQYRSFRLAMDALAAEYAA